MRNDLMMSLLNPLLIWFVIGFTCLLAELFIPAFVLVFFGAASWLVCFLTFIQILPGMASQIVVFITCSFIAIFLFRSRIKRYGKRRTLRSENSLVGSTGVLTTDLGQGSVLGKVEIHGTLWNAESLEPISRGTCVIVVAQDNLTLIVEPATMYIWES
jgi:inner membrane protein